MVSYSRGSSPDANLTYWFSYAAPLREEVEQLEKEAHVAKDEKEKIEQEVRQLEASISKYKLDYAALIRDVEALKAEMNSVTTKVTRAESLLTSLSQESERWSKSSETFQTIMKSLVGDGLLMAAFLTCKIVEPVVYNHPI